MKFVFFESLSHDDAKVFLERFLTVESAHIAELLKQCSSEGLKTNFDIDSVAPFMRWVAAKLKTIPKAPDSQLPCWIRESGSYARNLFEFDDLSKLLTLRAAYYLGESFVRNNHGLHWTTGNLETAEANMPVVSGFRSHLELAPILIAENLLRRVIAEPGKMADIDKAIDFWNQRI